MRGHCLLLASVVLAACAGSAAVAPAPSPSAPTPHERDGAQARRRVEAPAEGTRDAFPPELAAPLRTDARALALGPFAWPNNGLSVLTRSDLAFPPRMEAWRQDRSDRRPAGRSTSCRRDPEGCEWRRL